MHIITFIILNRVRLLTLTNRVIVCYHACINRLEFWKLRIVYFTPWSFRHRAIRRFRFRWLFDTLRLHFRFGNYAYFISWFLRCFTGNILLVVLLYVVLHFFVSIRRLLQLELATYYLLVTGWVLICKDRLDFSILFLRYNLSILIIIGYYLVNIMDIIILFLVILFIITIFLFVFLFNYHMPHFLHDLLHHFFVLRHLSFLLPVLVLVDPLEEIPLLLLWLVDYFKFADWLVKIRTFHV
jgi:hypothetical protein